MEENCVPTQAPEFENIISEQVKFNDEYAELLSELSMIIRRIKIYPETPSEGKPMPTQDTPESLIENLEHQLLRIDRHNQQFRQYIKRLKEIF